MLELLVLGASDLRGQDNEELTAILTQPKRLALLLYLHIARPHGFIRRDRLLAIFWPELDTTHARNALSKSVHHIRRALGDKAIITRGDEVLLDGAPIRSDVQDLEQALSSNDHERALELYRGPLADGLFVNDAPEFERWLDEERERLRTAVSNAAWTLADKSRKDGRFGDATAFARRAFSFTKEEEPALRRLMSFLESAGDRAGALRAYDTFSEWLSAELDAEPAPETQALHKRIRAESQPHFVELVTPGDAAAITRVHSAPTKDHPRSSLWIRVATAGAAVLAVGMLVVGLSSAKPSSNAALDPRRVVIEPFENQTGNKSYDAVSAMAVDRISEAVASSGLVSVADRKTTLAAATRAGLVVSGTYYMKGDRLEFQAQLTNASNGTISRVFLPVSAPVDSPTLAFEGVSRQAVSSIAEATDVRLSAFSRSAGRPPSLESYREYIQGADAFALHNETGSFKHFMRAYELDTTFTTALLNANAATLKSWAGTDSITAFLAARRSSLSPFNQLSLSMFETARKGDQAAAFQITSELARQAPDSYFPFVHASVAIAIDQPRAALNALLKVDPDRGWMKNWFEYWYVRCAARHMLGDFEGELADSKIAEKQYPANFAVITCKARALASLGREKEIDDLFDRASAMSKHGTWEVGSPLAVAAAEAEYHGYPAIAAKARKRTMDWLASQPADKMSVEPDLFGPAWFYLMAGAWPELSRRAKYLRARDPRKGSWLAYEGIAAAKLGDRATAMRVDSVLQILGKPEGDKGFGKMPLPISLYHRAEIAAGLGDKDRAIGLLTDAFANRLRYGVYTHPNPAFASVWRDPRFIRLMAPRD